MTEDPSWQQIDEALRLPKSVVVAPDMLVALTEAFKAAGFRDDAATRGIAMMHTCRYFGFVDAATSLAHAMGHKLTAAEESDIRDAGRAYDKGRGVVKPTKTPWGAPIVESQAKDAFGRPIAEAQPVTPWGRPAPRGPVGRLQESRSATQVRTRLLERAHAQQTGEGRLQVCLIDVGIGSAGYYSAEVLKQAAPLFREGLHCYLDHPTATEDRERPVRTVKDLAGVLAGDAVFRDGGIYADVRVFTQYRDQITEMAPYIGMSIRGDGEVTEGAVPGGRGPVVESISRVDSVDFVTRPGRGGRIVGAR